MLQLLFRPTNGGSLGEKPPVSPPEVNECNRANSSVPGLAEHAHPVASQDFRDVDGRVAVTHQFRAEDWEVSYSVEIPYVLESGVLIVGHLRRKQE